MSSSERLARILAPRRDPQEYLEQLCWELDLDAAWQAWRTWQWVHGADTGRAWIPAGAYVCAISGAAALGEIPEGTVDFVAELLERGVHLIEVEMACDGKAWRFVPTGEAKIRCDAPEATG